MGKPNGSVHKDGFKFLVDQPSIMGPPWISMYGTDPETPTTFSRENFEAAMLHVIREPNINSTAILRADILYEDHFELEDGKPVLKESHREKFDLSDTDAKRNNVDEDTPRETFLPDDLHLFAKYSIVRRMLPRNPYKDAVINQTCLVMNSTDPEDSETSAIIYHPHLDSSDICPFYIPHVKQVAILFHKKTITVHYIPFEQNDENGLAPEILRDESQRVVRTAYRLLQTAFKHSKGVMTGYEKKVNHDVVVDKVKFQDQYINLKKKYSKFLVENWAESTDPKKHVFEDISIAAFLIELWIKIYGPDFKEKMQFRDLGCGNGVLVYILVSEGVKGYGIDARHRKSWSIFPQETKNCLKEQVIIPSILLRPHPDIKQQYPQLEHNGRLFPMKVAHEYIAPATIVYSSEDLLKSPQVNIAEFPKDTFIIGNHSDELTCWIPLLGYPFMVIPCCSHNLAGNRTRFNVRKGSQSSVSGNSSYAGLVDHVEDISERLGWKVQKEMLRIPSTRNAAVISYENPNMYKFPTTTAYEVLLSEGGAENWIQNTMALMKGHPRSH
ncbi:tRNA(Ser) Um(44) 2'-O-methyltransferase [Maudiozyma exigua]|uniref:tRNA (uracil-O(2)-)-methyltransferase n=1 Tax=Maudiozyma exigua TaxID=34358 RepID=A0A9P6VV98_MAUEX|nr:tRNA(Ser) Um(44) 2'-O-methyltransferase [Kazachstania exigua]